MKVLFLHGWHSVPGGVKPTYLARHGHVVINPALDDDNFAAALATAQAEVDKHKPVVIVGSSRGGAVAMNLDAGNTPLVLLCPACKRIEHAWCERGGFVVDLAMPVGARIVAKETYYRSAKPEVSRTYPPDVAQLLSIRNGHDGPWRDDEQLTGE